MNKPLCHPPTRSALPYTHLFFKTYPPRVIALPTYGLSWMKPQLYPIKLYRLNALRPVQQSFARLLGGKQNQTLLDCKRRPAENRIPLTLLEFHTNSSKRSELLRSVRATLGSVNKAKNICFFMFGQNRNAFPVVIAAYVLALKTPPLCSSCHCQWDTKCLIIGTLD